MKQYYMTIIILYFAALTLLTGCIQTDSYVDEPLTFSFDDTTEAIPINTAKSYKTTDDAMKAAGFPFLIPETMPDGYRQTDISVVNNDGTIIVELHYKKGDNMVNYRVSPYTDNLLFSYMTYEKEKALTISDIELTCSCNGDTVYAVQWHKGGSSYCMICDEGFMTPELQLIFPSLQ